MHLLRCRRRLPIFLWLTLTFSLSSAIDLVTVPKKDSVQLTIYNSADITMVRDQRTLTFKKGINRIQFAWANTLIDPTSLRLSFKKARGDLELIDTVFPPNQGTALQWNIEARHEGAYQVVISYFTSGITWRADYSIFANASESEIDLTGYVTVINNSGEDFENAKIRLVVGYIHLVEDIQKLARGYHYYDLKDKERERARIILSEKTTAKTDEDEAEEQKKEVKKEGLSEYFIFTIDGTEDIANRWQKRMVAIEAAKVPLETIYRLSEPKTGGRVHKFYEAKNKQSPGMVGSLGETPLPNGAYQVFRREAGGKLSFQASVRQKYIASGDKIKLNLGYSGDILITRKVKDYRRGSMTLDTRYNQKTPYVKNYVESFFYETEIQNSLAKNVKIEIERIFYGDFKISTNNFRLEKVSRTLVRFYPELGPGQRRLLKYRVDVFRGKK